MFDEYGVARGRLNDSHPKYDGSLLSVFPEVDRQI